MRGFRFALTEFLYPRTYLLSYAKNAMELAVKDPSSLETTLIELKEISRDIALAAVTPEFVRVLRTPGPKANEYQAYLRQIGLPGEYEGRLEDCATETLISLAKDPDLDSQVFKLLLNRELSTDQVCSLLSFSPNSPELAQRLADSQASLQSFDGFISLLSAFKHSNPINETFSRRLTLEFYPLLLKVGSCTTQNLADAMELLDIRVMMHIYEIGRDLTFLSIRQLASMGPQEALVVLTSVYNLSQNYTFPHNTSGFKVFISQIPHLNFSIDELCKVICLLYRLNVKSLPYKVNLFAKQRIEVMVLQADLKTSIEILEAVLLLKLHKENMLKRIFERIMKLLSTRSQLVLGEEKLALFKLIKVLGENKVEVPPFFIKEALEQLPNSSFKELTSFLSACIATHFPEGSTIAYKRLMKFTGSLNFDEITELIQYLDKLDAKKTSPPFALYNSIAVRLLEIKNQWSMYQISFIAHRYSGKTFNAEIHSHLCTMLLEANHPDRICTQRTPDPDSTLMSSEASICSRYFYTEGDLIIYPQNSILSRLSVKSLSVVLYSLLKSRSLSNEVRILISKYLRCILEVRFIEMPSKQLINLGSTLTRPENFDRELVKLFIKAISSFGHINYEIAENWKSMEALKQIARNIQNAKDGAGLSLPMSLIYESIEDRHRN